ncbi:adenylyltransferase [Hypoxylon rubiginosum]|uniref:Adenylyltransferase n=1 Tax=Hypoxylon rubiginosum TaxID=110542 RepID=A0ACC0DLW1_9PEZI|nr:adenylyltransferase [Hypoxylon rubiginosum]
MDSVANKAEQVREQIARTENELQDLRRQLSELESPIQNLNLDKGPSSISETKQPGDASTPEWKWPLREEEYSRYGRQLILPIVGIKGQLRLKSTAVLIVGAGGLGCPAAAYLAGAGVGTLGVVDGDIVEVSNLHRQIAHSTSRVGMMKVDSLVEYCQGLNPNVTYVPHREHLTPHNAEGIVSRYDVVLDCTDHPTSRYLISDICILLQKPLVSASALRTDGQLIVLNNPAAAQGATDGGPCYRCVFPKPPPADSVVSCGEGGILGPVVGIMGVLQALEAIKLIVSGTGKETDSKPQEPVTPSLLLLSATSTTPFRSIRMRSRRPNCFACSAGSTLTLKELGSGSLDYVQFCGVTTPVNVLKPEERISATDYNDIIGEQSSKGFLLDVREKEHFNIASIPGAVNIPFSTMQSRSTPEYISNVIPVDGPIYVVCRVGNDSQLVAQQLKEMRLEGDGERVIRDIKGGMLAWKHEVDSTLPFT